MTDITGGFGASSQFIPEEFCPSTSHFFYRLAKVTPVSVLENLGDWCIVDKAVFFGFVVNPKDSCECLCAFGIASGG